MSSLWLPVGGGFGRLVTARTAVLLGNTMGPIGLTFGVLAMPGGNGRQLGLILGIRTAAQVAFLLAGGVLADRFSKVRVMVLADAGAAVGHLGTAALLLLRRDDLTAFLVLSALVGGATGTFLPASTGVLPELVEPDSLQQANGVLRVWQNVAAIGGATLAGFVIAMAGASLPSWSTG